jgi:hypothetical protein
MQSFLFRPANFLHTNQAKKAKSPSYMRAKAVYRAKRVLAAIEITRYKPHEERVIEAQTARATRRAENPKRKRVSNFSSDECF